MNLYELSHEYQEILDLLESVNISDHPEYEALLHDQLDVLEGAIEEKAENYFKIINQLKHDEEMVKEEISRLQQKKKALSNNRERLTRALHEEMDNMGIEKIKRPTVTICVQNNPMSLNVLSTEHIPDEYFIKQEPKLDRRNLLNHIKDTGEVFDGVEIKQTRGVRFR